MSTILSSLKLISAKREIATNPILFRREKLVKMLKEQINLATAYINGTTYTSTRTKKVRDEKGEVQTVDVNKRIKAWWFTSGEKIALTVRYGNRAIEFAKGKNAIEVADAKNLLTTLEQLSQAVKEGALDEQLTVASMNVKARFKK